MLRTLRSRSVMFILSILLVLPAVAGVVPLVHTASAQGGPELSVSPTSGPPGSQVTLTGTGLEANEAMIIFFVPNVSNPTGFWQFNTTSDSNGDFTTQITIPTGASTGDYYFSVTPGDQVDPVAEVDFEVGNAAPPPQQQCSDPTVTFNPSSTNQSTSSFTAYGQGWGAGGTVSVTSQPGGSYSPINVGEDGTWQQGFTWNDAGESEVVEFTFTENDEACAATIFTPYTITLPAAPTPTPTPTPAPPSQQPQTPNTIGFSWGSNWPQGQSQVVTVTASDPSGNPVSDDVINLSISGNGSVSSPSCTTDSSGACTFSVVDSTAETDQVTASDSSGGQASINITWFSVGVIGGETPPTSKPQSKSTCKAMNGYKVCNGFLTFWQHLSLNPGAPSISYSKSVALFGYPITNEFKQDGLTVQYFQRARFEYHPSAPANAKVELTLLGTQLTANRKSDPPFKASMARASVGCALYITHHQICNSDGANFLNFWNANGGALILGYPISEAFNEVSTVDGKVYTVQYFQRARIEWHPAQSTFELGLLGQEARTGVPQLQTQMQIPLISQYPAGWTKYLRTNDCGPTTAAMLVAFFRQETIALQNQEAFITAVRINGGSSAKDNSDFAFNGTTEPGTIEKALSYYGLAYKEISSSSADAAWEAIQNAVESGSPVIALIHGADIGRTTVNPSDPSKVEDTYGDHFVIVRGLKYNASHQVTGVYINDSDKRDAGQLASPSVHASASWKSSPYNNGQYLLDAETFEKALKDAHSRNWSQPYALAVSDS